VVFAPGRSDSAISWRDVEYFSAVLRGFVSLEGLNRRSRHTTPLSYAD
jgi:hypothetical protein